MKMRLARPDMQDYDNQRYIAHMLDERVFDALNTTDYPTFLYHDGALDAPDFMPAGSMVYVCGNLYDRSVCERGVSLQEKLEREAFMGELLADL